MVDDHAIVRAGLVPLLIQAIEDSPSIFEAGSFAQAVRVLEEHPEISLVVLDLSLPDARGVEALERLRGIFPEVPVVVLSASEDARVAHDAYRLGACGFVNKSSNVRLVVDAIRLVLAGGVCFPRGAVNPPPGSLVKMVEREFSELKDDLTGRQREVLKCLVQGMTNKEVARALNVSVGTVKNHVAAILSSLGVKNRASLVSTVLNSERGALDD